MRPIIILLCSCAIVLLSGCQQYRSQTLESADIFRRVETSRRTLDEAPAAQSASPQPLTIARASELMDRFSPALRDARAEYASAVQLAGVKTPLPNPSLTVGPQFGFGTAVPTDRITAFGSLGFTIPTGKRRKYQDELNCIQAELAKLEIQAKYREQYLAMRKLYSRLVLSHARLATRRQIFDAADKSVQSTQKLMEAGQATALDIGLLRLDSVRIETDSFISVQEIASAESDLSELIGVDAEFFKMLPAGTLPALPEKIPVNAELHRILLANHTELARIRARYDVAEQQLRLEVSKQNPDFHFGPSYNRDVGDNKTTLGLNLGIDLPIFDKNQQAIAVAEQKREEVRAKYEAAASRALAVLNRAIRNYGIASAKLNALKTRVAPQALTNAELVKKAIDAGAMDSLKLLEMERSQRAIRLDIQESEIAVREAWIEIEQAVGFPLVFFSGESSQTPPLNQVLDRSAVLSDAFSPPAQINAEISKEQK